MVVCCSIIIILVLALVSLLVLGERHVTRLHADQKSERLKLEGKLNESRRLATCFELAYNRERLSAERAADDAKKELGKCTQRVTNLEKKLDVSQKRVRNCTDELRHCTADYNRERLSSEQAAGNATRELALCAQRDKYFETKQADWRKTVLELEKELTDLRNHPHTKSMITRVLGVLSSLAGKDFFGAARAFME